MRDPRYDCLFEPIRLGPVTARNRFYQVPHCSGMGWKRPRMLAAMRGVKAEGGWGVVCTEYCSVHPTSDDGAYPFARLWAADDIRDNALMTEAVHAHGALAGVELWLGGSFIANLDTRLPPLGVISRPPTNADVHHPVQSRRLDKSDIADIRQWQATAARRAVEAGFDIVYVYATHGYLLSEFLNADTNDRTDEYGGSLENRFRIVRELIEVTRDAVAGKAAVAVRYAADMADPESFDAFGAMADLPDLWDLTIHDYDVEMGVSRFTREAALQEHVRQARAMTTKPVVAVGRFTSPDTMARVIREGTQDLIGAARPSIADPFLPKKIEEGRIEDIRECIGCNICYAHNSLGVPIRCTQNPTMGEEHRRGWHPERVPRISASERERMLVVGAGPAGLEAARALGARGYSVMLAEATRELGGRVTRESRLPGLSEWVRVRDWRVGQIDKTAQRRGLPGKPHDRRRHPRSRRGSCPCSNRIALDDRWRRPSPEPALRRRGRQRRRGCGQRACRRRNSVRPCRDLRRRPLLSGCGGCVGCCERAATPSRWSPRPGAPGNGAAIRTSSTPRFGPCSMPGSKSSPTGSSIGSRRAASRRRASSPAGSGISTQIGSCH